MLGGGSPVLRVTVAFGAQIIHVFQGGYVTGVCPGFVDHFPQFFRILQHGAGPQMVFIERLTIVVCHEQGRAQCFQQSLFPDVGIGIMNEHAGIAVTVGVDVEVTAAARRYIPPTYSPSFWKSSMKMGFFPRSSRIW